MANKIKMVADANGSSFQALHPASTILLDVAAVNRTSAGALDGVEIVRLVTTEACYIKFGDSDVAAAVTDVYIPAGIPEYFNLRGDKFISCIKTAAGAGLGKLHITLMD